MKRHTKVKVLILLIFTLSLMGLSMNSINRNYKNQYISTNVVKRLLQQEIFEETTQQYKTLSQKEVFVNSTQPTIILRQKKKFICKDREVLSSSLLKCPNDIEVQIEKETIKKVDFQVFLNSPNPSYNKESFSMVYAMESEPHSRYIQEIHQQNILIY